MKITILNINNKINDELEQLYDEQLYINKKVLLSDNFYFADNEHRIIIEAKAVDEIFDFIEWHKGSRTDIRVEQGGIMLGNRYYDCDKNLHYTIVKKVIVAEKAEGTSAFLEITPECWNDMYEQKDSYIAESGNEVVIVGWFHTHPNMLPVFMSGTDRNTQKQFFNGENTYSVVINPQRHLIKAFRAEQCFPTQAVLLLSDMNKKEE